MLGPAKGDGKLTFDKLTDLYHSGTKHEEDQPAHLVIHDTNICNTRCVAGVSATRARTSARPMSMRWWRTATRPTARAST